MDPELADVNDTITVTATMSGPVSASDISECTIALADATCTVSGNTITMYRTLDGHEYEDTALFSFTLFEGTDDQVTVDDTTDGSSVGIHFFALHCTPWSRLPWC